MRCLAALLALVAPLLLSACGGGGPADPVPPPRYGIGDTYGFDDGSVRSVVGTEGDAVFWRDNGADITTTRDILLPPTEAGARGHTIRQQIAGMPLFPLLPGKQANFVVTPLLPATKGAVPAREFGTCEAGGRGRTDTPAGAFETIRVDCTLRRTDTPEALHRTYFYAPAIGYFVRRDDRVGDGPTRSIRLVHYAAGAPPLPNAALLSRTHAIQSALEWHVSQTTIAWSDPSGNASGTIEPLLTVHSPRQGWCREFRERIQIASRHYDLLGTACRAQAGTWLVREITPYRAAS